MMPYEDMPRIERLTWRKSKIDELLFGWADPLPTQVDLARAEIVKSTEVVTSKGHTLTVPLALACPREILFDSGEIGEAATEFGRLAYHIDNRIREEQGVPLDDPEVIRLILLAQM